jgi:hypothetical protein
MIKSTLLLPDQFTPGSITDLPKKVPVLINGDDRRPICFAEIRLEDGVVVAELDVEASLCVATAAGEVIPISVGLFRMEYKP